MRTARFTVEPNHQSSKPVIYHCTGRVIEKRMVFNALEKEKMRTIMREYEAFSGNRILGYCFMSNHYHLLIEITPRPLNKLTDEQLLKRLSAIYNEQKVFTVKNELIQARKAERESNGNDNWVQQIHDRYTYRMHNLSMFMKDFQQKYAQWHNITHQRTGNLWENRYHSVLIEDGPACQTVAAYIDLNPVRAGMVKDAINYRWSSYGEAMGAGNTENGKLAQAGLVRALQAHKGVQADAKPWKKGISQAYRKILIEGSHSKSEPEMATPIVKISNQDLTSTTHMREKTSSQQQDDLILFTEEFAKKLGWQIEYFSKGIAIGCKEFVNEHLNHARILFQWKRKHHATPMQDLELTNADRIWSLRKPRLQSRSSHTPLAYEPHHT